MNPLIFLWSHPRSVSSAMERVMYERGDLRTFHEPFLYCYYLDRGSKRLAHFDPDPAHPASYEGIRDMILEAAESSAVFVKDMCYYVTDEILDDREFLERIVHTFLIRDPAKSIASYYRLDPGLTSEEVGIEASHRVFEAVSQIRDEVPVVINADDLVRDAGVTVRAWCEAVGLEYLDRAMRWDQPLPAEWRFVEGWHRDLSSSSGITSEKIGKPPELNDRLRSLYHHHRPFYEAMDRHRLGIAGLRPDER